MQTLTIHNKCGILFGRICLGLFSLGHLYGAWTKDKFQTIIKNATRRDTQGDSHPDHGEIHPTKIPTYRSFVLSELISRFMASCDSIMSSHSRWYLRFCVFSFCSSSSVSSRLRLSSLMRLFSCDNQNILFNSNSLKCSILHLPYPFAPCAGRHVSVRPRCSS